MRFEKEENIFHNFMARIPDGAHTIVLWSAFRLRDVNKYNLIEGERTTPDMTWTICMKDIDIVIGGMSMF